MSNYAVHEDLARRMVGGMTTGFRYNKAAVLEYVSGVSETDLVTLDKLKRWASSNGRYFCDSIGLYTGAYKQRPLWMSLKPGSAGDNLR